MLNYLSEIDLWAYIVSGFIVTVALSCIFVAWRRRYRYAHNPSLHGIFVKCWHCSQGIKGKPYPIGDSVLPKYYLCGECHALIRVVVTMGVMVAVSRRAGKPLVDLSQIKVDGKKLEI